MVIDNLSNINTYKALSKRIESALLFISQTNFTELSIGKYTPNEDFFFMVNEYLTKEKNECRAESHLKYIDIQFMIEGNERFGYEFKTNQKPEIEYLEENDVMFYEFSTEKEFILKPNEFVIFFPNDIHQPELQVISNKPEKVKKVVFKIKVD